MEQVAAMLLFASWFDWLRALWRRVRLQRPKGFACCYGNDTIPAASGLLWLWVWGVVLVVSGGAFAGARGPVGAAVVAVAVPRAGGRALTQGGRG